MSIVVEVVDCTFGRAAEGVPVTVWREAEAGWRQEASTRTDESGRADPLPAATPRGRYRVVLDLDQYFPGLGVASFQSRLDVAFRVSQPDEPVHLLLTVAPTASSVLRLATHGRPQ